MEHISNNECIMLLIIQHHIYNVNKLMEL